jgi:hypothetical protein
MSKQPQTQICKNKTLSFRKSRGLILIARLILLCLIFISTTASVGCSQDETTNPGDPGSPDPDPFTLLNTIDVSPILSPNGDGVGRPDVVALGGALYLAYGILNERNFHLVKLNSDLDLTQIGESPSELFSGYHNFSVDIRVSKANNSLWYAFEDNKWNAAVDSTHFLNAAWYSPTNTLVAEQTDIATGISTSIPEAFQIDPNDVPPNPEAVDDPTPLWHNNSYYIFTRAWSGWIEEFTPVSNHHVRVFNESFEKTDDFMVDFSTVLPGKSLSQNTLIDINGQIYLIGGFYNARNDMPGGSSVFAVPLADDLKTTAGEAIPILVEPGKWFHKTTAARMYNGNLYINYQELISGGNTQNLAVIDVSNNFELISTIEISSDFNGEIIASHVTFEIVDDRLYIFYPAPGRQIHAKIFGLPSTVPTDTPLGNTEELVLHGAHPNPFNPQTTIAFDLPERANVSLRVFDVFGRLVRKLIDREDRNKGHHVATWAGCDSAGRRVASGTYIYHLQAGKDFGSRSMVMIK